MILISTTLTLNENVRRALRETKRTVCVTWKAIPSRRSAEVLVAWLLVRLHPVSRGELSSTSSASFGTLLKKQKVSVRNLPSCTGPIWYQRHMSK